VYTKLARGYGDQLTSKEQARRPQITQAQDLPIGVLHLGIKTTTLERAGFRTVGDLAHVSRDHITSIPGVGGRTADQLLENREALLEVSTAAEGTDWDKYCEKTHIPLLPSGSQPASGKEFLACLPHFLAEVAEYLADETLAAILRERICQPPGRQKTLDEIAEAACPPVTRERIRQKEKKLLLQLTNGLLNDAYGALAIHFRPEFSNWWKRAADCLSHLEEVGFEEFVDTLSATWDVPKDAVTAELAIIVAIVTGEPQMSGDFRAASRIDPRLFGALSDEVLTLPLDRLRLGRYGKSLFEEGAATVGDIVTKLQAGGYGPTRTKAGDMGVQLGNLLASCLSDDGSIDWKAYREAEGLSWFPARPVANASEFALSLISTVSDLIAICHITKRAQDIYLLRTSRTLDSQLTLQAVAKSLHTHLPTVKREETIFLRFLNRVLIGRNFNKLPVWIDGRWLTYWDEALASYETTPNSFNNFSENLAWKWQLTMREISIAAPTIWAVLSGYPSSKRTPRRVPIAKKAAAPTSQLPVGRIRLRGFRRVH